MNFKKHDVVRYTLDNYWCRHGIAVILGGEGAAYARDTYWGVGEVNFSDSGWVREEDLVNPELLGNIDDFEANKYLEPGDFRPEDHFYIPIGGGSSQNWYRKGAQPDPDRVYIRLVYQVEKAENEIGSAQRALEWRKRELNEHIGKFGIPNKGEKTDVL